MWTSGILGYWGLNVALDEVNGISLTVSLVRSTVVRCKTLPNRATVVEDIFMQQDVNKQPGAVSMATATTKVCHMLSWYMNSLSHFMKICHESGADVFNILIATIWAQFYYEIMVFVKVGLFEHIIYSWTAVHCQQCRLAQEWITRSKSHFCGNWCEQSEIWLVWWRSVYWLLWYPFVMISQILMECDKFIIDSGNIWWTKLLALH